MNAKQIDVMVADASHEVYVDKILDTIREAAKVRGTGRNIRIRMSNFDIISQIVGRYGIKFCQRGILTHDDLICKLSNQFIVESFFPQALS